MQMLRRVLLEYGDTIHSPLVNNSFGNVMDAHGMVWAQAKTSDWDPSTYNPPAGGGRAIITAVVPRFNFDNFGHSFLTCFGTMTMANWNDNFYEVAVHPWLDCAYNHSNFHDERVNASELVLLHGCPCFVESAY